MTPQCGSICSTASRQPLAMCIGPDIGFGLNKWPVSKAYRLHFNGSALTEMAGPVDRIVMTQRDCGEGTGEYFPFGFGPGELPDNQIADDKRSCCFDSVKLDVALPLVGAPEVKLQLGSDKECGQIAVRLCDLRPDGTSALISHGFLNLRQRGGHGASEPLIPDEIFDIVVPLDQCGYVVPARHQLRIAISASYWPFIWPEGEDATLSIKKGELSLSLLPAENSAPCDFGPPVTAVPLQTRRLTARVESKHVVKDPSSGEIRIEILGDDGAVEDLNTGLVKSAKGIGDFFDIPH